ncbi:hypothetical protein O4H56_05235 [Pseudomonas anguilliseptica]|nr:hypothetical protein [Pseudomonas anguilliseptica]
MSDMSVEEFKRQMKHRSTVVMRVALVSFMSSLAAMEIWGPMAGLVPALAYAAFTLLY